MKSQHICSRKHHVVAAIAAEPERKTPQGPTRIKLAEPERQMPKGSTEIRVKAAVSSRTEETNVQRFKVDAPKENKVVAAIAAEPERHNSQRFKEDPET